VRICTSCGHENSDDAQFCEECRDYLWGDSSEAGNEQPVVITTGVADQPAASADVADSASPAAAPQRDPAPVQPAPEFEPPPPVRPAFAEPEPGELICDECGSGNRAHANFCRRCGASLTGARTATRPPWWRRMFSDGRRAYAAGHRKRASKAAARTTAQKARHALFQVSRTLAVLAVLGIVSVGVVRGDLIGRAGEELHGIRLSLFPHYEPVVVSRANATSSAPGHGPLKAFDGNVATWWSVDSNRPHGQKLVAHFGREAHVARLGITLGNPDHPERFVNLRVPHRVRLRLFDRHGDRLASKLLFLAQKPNFQRFSMDAAGVTKAVLTIASVFPSRGRHHASIAEVEYFEKD
jgi:ribosomal protein L40E